VYDSGSQPGVREKSQGVRQIFIILRLLMGKTEVASKTLLRGT